MPLRNNAYSRLAPDPYGNTYGTMIPEGAVKPRKSLVKRPELINPNETVAKAQESVAHLKPLEKPVFDKQDFDYLGASMSGLQGAQEGFKAAKSAKVAADAAKAAKTTADVAGTASKAGKALGSNLSAGAAAGVGAAAAIGSIAGSHLEANKKEKIGGVLKGASSGASLGMTLGSVVPGIGTAVGAAGGALIGATAGLITGGQKQDRREKQEAEEERRRKKYNREVAEIKRKTIGRAQELSKYQRVLNEASRYDSQGNMRYKKGGLIKYDIVNINDIKEHFDKVESEIKDDIKGNIKKIFSAAGKELKKGKNKKGKLIFKTIKIVNTPKQTPIFRRGGKADLAKSNVIVDGPSHDDYNNTNIKEDRGLPIVKNGKKIAEIESMELVLDKDSVVEIERLAELAKKDPKYKKKLGEFIAHELANNTYDYTELMKD